MFRILVADDEGIMLESIKSIILSNFGSECQVACVKTGRAVIEQAEAFRPDIAIVDIQMPGLSGIQAIREVRSGLELCSLIQEKKLSTRCIFLSAHAEFSYAQEAVNLGVMEFITKPVNKKKILDVCIRAMHQVEEARKKLSDDLKIREKLELVVPMIESGFIYNLLRDDTDIYRKDYLEMLDIKVRYGFAIVLEFGDGVVDGLMTNAVGANVRLNKYYTQLRELVKDYFDCITGPVMGNRIVLFVPFEREKTRYEERVEIITRTRNMIYRLEAGIDMQFRGGIGMVTPVEEAMDSYKGALRALRESDSHVVHITDIPAIANYDGEYPLKLENQYFQRGAKADKEGAAACANEFFDWMLEHDGNVRANIEVKVLELIIRLEMMAFEEGSVRYGFRYRENYLEEIQGAADMAALRCWFVRKTREVCDNISTSRERESENVVFRVKSYINDNYAQDISLDDVSRLVDISPYYFSKLFKQEVGENFIEYLTRTRITHAMRLLEDSRYSIKEVCLMCGYSDPNYFSRIFKKYEGMTPSEYRER